MKITSLLMSSLDTVYYQKAQVTLSAALLERVNWLKLREGWFRTAGHAMKRAAPPEDGDSRFNLRNVSCCS